MAVLVLDHARAHEKTNAPPLSKLMYDLTTNPFLKIDLHSLVSRGYVVWVDEPGDSMAFTASGLEKLRIWVRQTPEPASDGVADRLAKLRAAGWMVAIHNDYRQGGKFMTFWLFTNGTGRWLKGEAATDAEALAEVCRVVAIE